MGSREKNHLNIGYFELYIFNHGIILVMRKNKFYNKNWLIPLMETRDFAEKGKILDQLFKCMT